VVAGTVDVNVDVGAGAVVSGTTTEAGDAVEEGVGARVDDAVPAEQAAKGNVSANATISLNLLGIRQS